MPDAYTVTWNVQYAHFAWDEAEEKGPIGVEEAVAAFRDFPFEEQQRQAETLAEPTAPTLSFVSHPDGASLAIWSVEPGAFEVHLQFAGKRVTLEETDPHRIEPVIRAFFAGQRAELFRRLSDALEAQAASAPANRSESARPRGAARRQSDSTQDRAEERFLAIAAAVMLVIAGANLLFALGVLFSEEARSAVGPLQGPVRRELYVAALLGFSLVLGEQLHTSVRQGYVYCGVSNWVTKAQNPRLYRMYLLLHGTFVALPALWMINVLFRL